MSGGISMGHAHSHEACTLRTHPTQRALTCGGMAVRGASKADIISRSTHLRGGLALPGRVGVGGRG